MPCVSTQKTKPQLAGWQGKRREQVEFAATLAMASIGALFVIVIALFLLQHFN
jgi:hypothetical protein